MMECAILTCPDGFYGTGDNGLCVTDSEGPSDKYADESTHLFSNAETCNGNDMYTYVSDDSSSRRCVVKCDTTDKKVNDGSECISACPANYYS
jgi:hypothetical protein